MSDCSRFCVVSRYRWTRRSIRFLLVFVQSLFCGVLAYQTGYGQTGYISTIAGVPSYAVGGYTGDGGPAKSATFRAPWGVATDAAGNIYVSDTFNNVVRKIDAKTGVVTTIAGNGYGAGYYPETGGYTGDGGLATSAELYGPVATTVDGVGNLYIADEFNHLHNELGQEPVCASHKVSDFSCRSVQEDTSRTLCSRALY